jgi:hypothetical protein
MELARAESARPDRLPLQQLVPMRSTTLPDFALPISATPGPTWRHPAAITLPMTTDHGSLLSRCRCDGPFEPDALDHPRQEDHESQRIVGSWVGVAAGVDTSDAGPRPSATEERHRLSDGRETGAKAGAAESPVTTSMGGSPDSCSATTASGSLGTLVKNS